MPGAPAASGGASATCRRPHAHSHLVPVVLDGLCPRLGQVGDLMRVPHPQIAGVGQVRPARADALREHVLGLVRVLVPGQERARRAGLLARLALRRRRCRVLRSGGFFPGRSSAPAASRSSRCCGRSAAPAARCAPPGPRSSRPCPPAASAAARPAPAAARSPRAAQPHRRAHRQSRAYRAPRHYIRAGPP